MDINNGEERRDEQENSREGWQRSKGNDLPAANRVRVVDQPEVVDEASDGTS